MLTILTNNQPRELVCYFDVPKEKRSDFDYIEENDRYTARLAPYKGEFYDVDDCEPVGNIEHFNDWHGYFSETFFSGVLFRYVPDTDYEEVVMGRYYS